MSLLGDEDVVAQIEYHPDSKAEPFAIVVTTQAFHLLRKRGFAVQNPYFYDRIELAEMRAIQVKRLRAGWWYVLAVLLVVVGTYTTWGMFNDAYRNNGGQVSGWPIAALVGALAKQKQDQILSTIVKAARKIGVIVNDERAAA